MTPLSLPVIFALDVCLLTNGFQAIVFETPMCLFMISNLQFLQYFLPCLAYKFIMSNYFTPLYIRDAPPSFPSSIKEIEPKISLFTNNNHKQRSHINHLVLSLYFSVKALPKIKKELFTPSLSFSTKDIERMYLFSRSHSSHNHCLILGTR